MDKSDLIQATKLKVKSPETCSPQTSRGPKQNSAGKSTETLPNKITPDHFAGIPIPSSRLPMKSRDPNSESTVGEMDPSDELLLLLGKDEDLEKKRKRNRKKNKQNGRQQDEVSVERATSRQNSSKPAAYQLHKESVDPKRSQMETHTPVPSPNSVKPNTKPGTPQTGPKKFHAYIVVRKAQTGTLNVDDYLGQLLAEVRPRISIVAPCDEDLVIKCIFRSFKEAHSALIKCKIKKVQFFFLNKLPKKYLDSVKCFELSEGTEEANVVCKKTGSDDCPGSRKSEKGTHKTSGKKVERRKQKTSEEKEVKSDGMDKQLQQIKQKTSVEKQGESDGKNKQSQQIKQKTSEKKQFEQSEKIKQKTPEKKEIRKQSASSSASSQGQTSRSPKVASPEPDKFLISVFVTILDVVKENLIEGFLNARMGIHDRGVFAVTSFQVNEDKSITSATLKFKTGAQASAAVAAIKKSNIDSATRIEASLTSADDTIEARKKTLASLLRDMDKIHVDVMNQQAGKSEAVKRRIENLKPLTEKSRNISFSEYQRVEEEKLALESELSMMLKQKEEYRLQIQDIKHRIEDSVQFENFQDVCDEGMKNFGIEKCRLEANLPIYGRRREILDVVRTNQVVVVRGETGSGKSTQLVQYLYQAGFAQKGIICCTQPRKVACSSLAERVATELASPLGKIVGSKSGGKRVIYSSTKIVYQTHHSLLNACLKDPKLEAYACLIIDEAHERTIFTDILISIVKTCLQLRPELKVIVASATIDVGIFSEYFGQCPVLEISGRAFPVEVIWREPDRQHEDFKHIERRSVDMAAKLHWTEGQGDILVFLTAPQETLKCKEELERQLEANGFTNYRSFAFHGQMPAEDQMEIFSPLPEGQRKIIFATNTAETSITITGVKFVIDSGLAKEKSYDPVRNTNTLRIQTISRSAAEQRKGRAGRTCPGVCYRLYTRESFEEMRQTTDPEIKKIHLGHAMLLLLELGIDPIKCDFVEPPCMNARLAALKTLEDLGCIRENKITELGKFLVKIPLEPRLGVMVKLGLDQGILYDAIVFAVLLSYNSHSIFYRNGSENEKKSADELKLRFCDNRGDGITFLKVYEEWSKQKDKGKNKWCIENKINSKTLRAARDTVNDVITALKKELNITVKEKFASDQTRGEILQKMVLYAFFDNVCHSMTTPRDAYFSSELDQRVFVHPGSALKSLNARSLWLVFGSFLRTSKDFITTLTPVEESWIEDIRKERNITRDVVKEADERRLVNIHTEGLGPTTMREIVGAKYTNLRKYEDELSEDIQSPVVLEVDRDLGEIRLFSTLSNLETVDRFKEMVKKVRDSIAVKTREYVLGRKAGGRVRVVLGRGGQGQMILVDNEYRRVAIHKPNIHDTSLKRITQKFSAFGEILEVFDESRVQDTWGILTFARPEDAAKAVAATKSDRFEVAEPAIRLIDKTEFQFKAYMKWCRRPLTGLAYADVNPLLLAQAARLRHIQIHGKFVEISVNNKDSVVLKRIPANCGFEDVRDALRAGLGLHDEESRQLVKKVTLVREKVTTGPEEVRGIRTLIKGMITTRGVPETNFEVVVNSPKSQADVEFGAQLMFSDLKEGMRVCKRLDNRKTINEQVVKIKPDLSARILVPKVIYNATKKAIDAAIEFFRNRAHHPTDVCLAEKQISHDRVSLKISASNPVDLVRIREVVAMEVKGDVLECWKNENYRLLFLESGRNFLKQVGMETKTHIALDERKFTLSFYGDTGGVTRAKSEINNFVGDLLEERCREMQLNGDGQPKGLLKELVKTYNLNLETLIEETGIATVLLDHSTQHLKITGPPEAVDRAFKKIYTVAQKLMKKKKNQTDAPEKSLPECVICLMEVEGLSKFQRLECCGHAYCLDCLHQQVNVAIQNKSLPVECGEEGCGQPFVWQDFQNCFNKTESIDVNRLVAAAVDRYVMEHSTSYKHCVTPDCPLVYRVSSLGEARVCPECRVRFCPNCHDVFHEGLTCYQFQNGMTPGDAEMEMYLQEHSSTVKKCPKCSVPVEKNYGCDHMQCPSCKVHFCWKCLAYFSTSDPCYDHMVSAHGDIGIDYER